MVQVLRKMSSQLQQEVEKEQQKVCKLQGELDSAKLVENGLRQDLGMSHTFSKKVGRAVGLEQEVEGILATEHLANDAIIMKAKQLAKHEVSMLVIQLHVHIYMYVGTHTHTASYIQVHVIMCVHKQSEELVNKQTVIYSMQRKLKVCRQREESKTLHLRLLQRKLQELEERERSARHREVEWETATNKVGDTCSYTYTHSHMPCAVAVEHT